MASVQVRVYLHCWRQISDAAVCGWPGPV